eukprot:CAMPEP_0119006484 /NCGR_PEP_ID=MMETSP1176-20130426/2316_1 /TAXON_ID=265551 /ORGANISM="Synedropsis recta cf, Strain CCMP1620" /LENGTH=312 /DNA_ID=CAMNT_0006958397 /DNA_START=59 /DNA_END=997 /DNA_ORIENTATION=+
MCISRSQTPRRRVSLDSSAFHDIYDAIKKPSGAEPLVTAQHVKSMNPRHHYKHHGVHHIVMHNYHDHTDDIDDGSPYPVVRGGVTTPFPIKLHEMLDQIERDGFGDVISWQPHGRCFVVHKPQQFVDHVMPTYFKQSKFPSFQRQLNLYGFQRLTKGEDKGGYYHEMFLQGKLFLAHRIARTRVKGTGVRARSNPATEPNFYSMKSAVVSSSEKRDAVSPLMTLSEGPLIPEMVSSSVDSLHDDDICDFEGMQFHVLDADEGLAKREAEAFSRAEMDTFLNHLNISKELYDDIVNTVDDDFVFGDLLERVLE